MRSIERRDTGQSYEEFLAGLAKASGIETPTREESGRLDRKRKKRMSNQEWKSPSDEDARITNMKDGRTHLAHKAEHAVDLDTGAVVAVTLQGADLGDTTTLDQTLSEAGMAVADLVEREAEHRPEEKPKVNIEGIEEVVTDKGYHSGGVVKRTEGYEVKTYIPEKQQSGNRRWEGKAEEQEAVYRNRRRVQGEHGKNLLRRRGELVERSFAHCYETGGMRRTHLRAHENILKRQLIHVGAFNLSLILRVLLGSGKPREWKDQQAELFLRLFFLLPCFNGPNRPAELRIFDSSRCLLTQTNRRSGGARASEIQILAPRAARGNLPRKFGRILTEGSGRDRFLKTSIKFRTCDLHLWRFRFAGLTTYHGSSQRLVRR
ncbi:MAG TPA: transposase [Candidatus Polarisedimenticolia bacterium]|nr:transposase [Candidatus Polarisedimenticolia bacterium]